MTEKKVVMIVWSIGMFFGFLGVLLAFILPLDPF